MATPERTDPRLEPDQLLTDLTPLAASTDPEHLLTLALLRSNAGVESSVGLMSRALRYAPGNPLILMNLGEACFGRAEAPACAGRDLERELLRVGGSNGAIWARIAAWRHRRGDRDGALDALRRASVAPAYDGYWIAYNQLFQRALAASTDYTYEERMAAATGMAATVAGHEFDVVRICGKEMPESSEWQRACAQLGSRMEADADIVIGVAAGLALQIGAHEATGETEELAAANRRLRELNALNRLSQRDRMLLQEDQTLLSEFMAEFAAHGELAAVRYLKGVTARREPIPDFDPCAE